MKTINNFAGKIVLGLASMLVLCNGAAAQCPAYLQKQIDAAAAATFPVGWNNAMATLDLSDPADNPSMLRLSPDLSIVTSTKEYQDFAVRYKYTSVGLDPAYDSRGRLLNYATLQGNIIGTAQKRCNLIGNANQRVRELIEANQADLQDYLYNEWIDFNSNSLSVSGTVMLYIASAGKALQVAKSVRGVMAVKDMAMLNGLETQNLLTRLKVVYEYVELLQPLGKVKEAAAALTKTAKELQRLELSFDLVKNLGRATAAQLTAAESSAMGKLMTDIKIFTGVAFGTADNVAMQAAKTCTGGCDVTTTVLLGGNVWKQFAGYRNPYEENMTIVLENKKKLLQGLKADLAAANKYRQAADAERVALVRLSQTPPPTGVFYGGFTVSLPK